MLRALLVLACLAATAGARDRKGAPPDAAPVGAGRTQTPQEIMAAAARDAAEIVIAAGADPASGVVALESYVNFKQLHIAVGTLLVEITGPSCGKACEMLAQPFRDANAAVRRAGHDDKSIVFARADTNSQAGQRLTARHGVTQFPTLLLFKHQRGQPLETLDAGAPLIEWTEQGLSQLAMADEGQLAVIRDQARLNAEETDAAAASSAHALKQAR